jgi:RNA polymerase sigma-70 factor (ECF subfamily)
MPLVQQQDDAAAQSGALRGCLGAHPRFERGAVVSLKERGSHPSELNTRELEGSEEGAGRPEARGQVWYGGFGLRPVASGFSWDELRDQPRVFFRVVFWSVYTLETFEELYRQHAQAVFRYAMRVAGRKDTAEDLTSEAFLALYRNLDGIDQAQLPAWLLTVVRNRARDLWRHRAVEQRYVEQLTESPAIEPGPMEQRILDSPELTPVQRTCLMLRYGYGMTRAEIAAKTGLRETQVKGHLQYALVVLRKLHGGSR